MAPTETLASRFLRAAGLSVVFAVLSFAWSMLGFASPTPPIHFHEYAFPALVTEVGGHVIFGVLAALPTMDISLIFLTGGESVLIDTDHLLAALGYPVEGRVAHSVFFALAAAGILAFIVRKNGRPNKGVFLVTLSCVAAHLSYDVFAGNGFFYILSPLTFNSQEFPIWTWPILLTLGLLFSALNRFGLGRQPQKSDLV